jgi:hypothetical protein
LEEDEMLPTFMILGAAKAGTTALWYYLGQHPEIFMSHPKEPAFFQTEYELGTEYYLRKYFRDYKGQREVGEAAHRNLFLSYVPQRIAKTLPQARFVVMVRDPVQRAISHYWDDYTNGVYPMSLEVALQKDLERLKYGPCFSNLYEYVSNIDKYGFTPKYPTILDSGYYADQINRYISLFGEQRIKIVFQEDLLHKTSETLNDILRFLRLPVVSIKDLSPQGRPIPLVINRFYMTVGLIPGISLFPSSWREAVKRKINAKFIKKKPFMNPETLYWMKDHYLTHNKKLEILTGRDLSHWGVIKEM